MECFVTGASGFIGSNLVHELVAQGHRVRALLRPVTTDLRALAGVKYDIVTGDLGDVAALKQGMDGCDWCFHVAASYHLWMRDYRPMFETNVTGTRNVLEAATHAGCNRIVYTSTVGCIGAPKPVKGHVVPSDELRVVSEKEMKNPYKKSKWQAEQIAFEYARKGVPVMIVNPSAPIGPRDVKPTPTGRVIVDFLNRAMPAYIDTGLNWVHVRDVVQGHILAAKKGQVGERYILGNGGGNMTMKEAFDLLEQITGIEGPRRKIPYAAALTVGYLNAIFSKITGIPPKAPLAGVRMARQRMYFNPAKAVRDLGLPQTPVKQALADAVEWYRANGYVKK